MGEVKVKGGQGMSPPLRGFVPLQEEEGMNASASTGKATRGHSEVANYKTGRPYQEQTLPAT